MRFKEFKEAFGDDGWDSLISKHMSSMLSGGNQTDLIKSLTDLSGKQKAPVSPVSPATDTPANAIGFDKPSAANKSQINPVQGPVNSKFGEPRKGRSHPGVDIGAQSGTPIKAPITGQVTQAEMSSNDCGGTIAISDGNVQHRFCHCSKINVSVGQYVKQGAVVGLTGGGKRDAGRGRSSGPHLHWEKKLASGGLVNPMA
jgi:murein DD-endopeptidase MepM/ murein hydrolase activator NlpD